MNGSHSATAQLRLASLSGIGPLIRDLGADPAYFLDLIGLPTPGEGHDDVMIPAASMSQLLERVADERSCPDIGLRLAGQQDILVLGLLGLMMAGTRTLRELVILAQHYISLHNQGETWQVFADDNHLVLSRLDHFPGLALSMQYHDMALGLAMRTLQQLCGPRVQPVRLHLSYRPTLSARAYQQFFGCEVRFDQEQDQLVFPADIQALPVQPLPTAIRAQLQQHLRQMLDVTIPLEAQVRALILEALPVGEPDLPRIASLMELHPRTLQRRLGARGFQYRQILLDVRIQNACWHLRNSTVDITRLSLMLGYQDATAFSKAFRRVTGLSPLHWRHQHGN